jgi:hypothetical protein
MSSSNTTKGARSQPVGAAQKAKGQKVSSERGTATNHKKNPGKRPHQGGGSR